MRIFVAGATGAVGRRLVPRLVRAGHSVTGLTHTPSKAGFVRELGAEPVVSYALDERSIRAAVVAAHPDVIVHELTHLKGASDLRKFDRAFANSNRLRTAGTDHLLAAARDCGVRRIVAQSFCGWPYARTGGQVKSEDDPLDPNPPQQLRRTLDAIRYLERVVTTSGAPEGVVLRYGAFYGPDTGMFDAALIEQNAGAACHSSAAAPRGGRSCKSMTPRRRPPWRSNSEEASTISSTTIPRRSTNGFPRPPQCSAQSRRSACRHGSLAWRPANISSL